MSPLYKSEPEGSLFCPILPPKSNIKLFHFWGLEPKVA